MLFVDDTSFRHQILAQPLPALVCFRSPDCAAGTALKPLLAKLATAYHGRMLIAEVHCDMVAEQYGIDASPTLSVFRYGNEVLRSVGFLPPGLLALLCKDALHADGEYPRLWSPVEEQFEDAVLLPLLDALGLRYQRQQRIINWAGNTRGGRIDVLVYDEHGPTTLIESKRALRIEADLRQAVRQAHSYARAMRVPTFVIAAPSGLWLYTMHDQHAAFSQSITWLELQHSGEVLRDALARHADAVH